MRALILLLPLAVALAGDNGPLDEAAKQWASDSAEERDAGSRAVAQHLDRELKPLVAALKSPDPEVRRRARASLEALLPPRPPEPPQVPEPWAQQIVAINNARAQRARIILNAQGQAVLVQDQGEFQQLQAKGITGMPVSDPIMRDQLCLAEGRGFAVTAVEARSDAARLGIQSRDILLLIDGVPVMQTAEVLKGIAVRAPEIKLLRRGKLVTLGAKEEVRAPGEGK